MINCSQFGFAAVAAERGEGGGQVAITPRFWNRGAWPTHLPTKSLISFCLSTGLLGDGGLAWTLAHRWDFCTTQKWVIVSSPPPSPPFQCVTREQFLAKTIFLACQLVAERWEDVYCSVLEFFFFKIKKNVSEYPPPINFSATPGYEIMASAHSLSNLFRHLVCWVKFMISNPNFYVIYPWVNGMYIYFN